MIGFKSTKEQLVAIKTLDTISGISESLADLESATNLRFYFAFDSLLTIIDRQVKKDEYRRGANVSAWLLMQDDIDSSLSPRDWLFIK